MLLIAFFVLCVIVASRVVDVPSVSISDAFRFWVLLLFLSAMVLTGAIGMFLTVFSVRTSAERRQVIAKSAANLQQHLDGRPAEVDYPTIPRDENLSNSPGTTLKYRLPQIATPAWGLLFLAMFCLLWLAALATMLAVVTKSFLDGSPRWFLLVLTFLLAAVAVRVLQTFIARVRVAVRIGPSHVEISDLPLYAGQRYEACIVQSGRMRLSSIGLHLVCEEHATFREGTNVRREKQRVYAEPLLERHSVEVSPSEPLVLTGEFVVPEELMHSFQADSNAVKWSLELTGEIIRGPNFCREFPVLIYPRVA